jgi:hypothetical protein
MENGLLSEKQLTWFSDRDGYLGRGKNIATTALSPGAHTISMRGFDNDQQENHDKITIYVAGEKMQKMNIDTK